jgi:hypothetical protein
MPDTTELIAARFEGASKEFERSFLRQMQQTDTVARLRLEFFDRLALLDGGTVALSVTLLGFLAGRNQHALNSALMLFLSWGCFVFSMVLALTRNWIEHNRLSAAESNNFLIAVAELHEARIQLGQAILGEGSEVEQMKELREQGKAVLNNERGQHERLLTWTKIAGVVSLASSVSGIILLLWFWGQQHTLALARRNRWQVNGSRTRSLNFGRSANFSR